MKTGLIFIAAFVLFFLAWIYIGVFYRGGMP